ncbi:general transcription factor II-I repeat domain-containing protein 2A [Trichonephila clavipes]|nr:general transcription factor II-I repeat domain-containing protein 2A [Trichonephila clavipes]
MFKYVSKNCHTSAASYSAANAIARHGKPFQEGEFLKEAYLASASSLFDDFDNKDKIIQRIKDVPLSRNTMKDRILKLAENVTDQQKNDINSAPFISLCLDEITTDGAPNMVGKKNGFISLFKTDVGHSILECHCIIHQQALCAKSGLTSLDNILRNQYPEQPPPAVITALIRLGIGSERGWIACTGTDAHAASTVVAGVW